MKTFSEYFEKKDIIYYLCKMRASLAHQKNSKHLLHQLTNNETYNYHKQTRNDAFGKFERELCEILPPRRKWVKLSKMSRQNNGRLLSTVEKNELALQKTINFFGTNQPGIHFNKKMLEFIDEINRRVFDKEYEFGRPITIPKVKEEFNKKTNKTICRPISMYSLHDRLIVNLTNKYFTILFDDYFSDVSYAFRSTKIDGEKRIILTHHDTVERICEFRKRFENKGLWVAEFDIQKFYDSVNHTIIKKMFNKLLKQVGKDKTKTIDENAISIFNKFLDSYEFRRDVYSLNSQENYFEKFRIKNGEFEWVEKELLSSGNYKSLKNTKIGVPQGGALSGLIANIVLDYADKKMIKASDKNTLYLRYCDDMVIIHPDKDKCLDLCNIYVKSIEQLKLIPHEAVKKLTNSEDSFWKAKSKGPYFWTADRNSGFPWISFVGYDIQYDGNVRIRKKSIKKEMGKQYATIEQVKHAIKKGLRVSKSKAKESLIYRLIGMSVGRVKLWNFDKMQNEKMCWVNGFQEITKNKYLVAQLKMLDRCRNKLFSKFKKWLRTIDKPEETEIDRKSKRQLIYFGKPFSYYYQSSQRIESRDIVNKF